MAAAVRVVAIDPGIVNLAWVVATVSFNPVRMVVMAYGNEDTTRECVVPGCGLKRSRELWDRLRHTDEHVIRPHAATADHVLVERQPPQGLGEVSSFFYSRYPQTELVHPRSVHKYFGIGGFDYAGRKVMSVKIAQNWIPDLSCGGRRTHDVADAVCIAWYWANAQAPPPAPAARPKCPATQWMDVFKYDNDTPAPCQNIGT